MISKANIKLIRSLARKKYRLKHQLFMAEGEKIITDMLRDEHAGKTWKIRSVYHTEDWTPPETPAGRLSPAMHMISNIELKQCSLMTTPNKVLALAEIPEIAFNPEEITDHLTLVLDSVRDPGNLGTIVRIAHWFGVKNIICSEDSVDLYNPKTIQATMGSFLAVKVHYLNLENFLQTVSREKRGTIYGSYTDGSNIYNLKPGKNPLILMGNESTGIDDRLEPLVDQQISIPSFSPSDRPDSLNVAAATGIILSEFRRHQLPLVLTDG